MISSDCSSVPFSGARPASTVDDIRIHSVDEGLRDADPVLMLHGEPSWSYLYRKVLPGIVAAGYRVLAPDLVGFGRSDKPIKREEYTYPRHLRVALGQSILTMISVGR